MADTSIPPHPDGPFEVKALTFFLDIQSINSAKQTYTANVFYRIRWQDDRLAHAGPGNVTYPLTEIWSPEIYILNRSRIFTSYPEIAEVRPSGEVIYRQRAWGDFTQSLDLREFPFDEHRFSLAFVAVGHTEKEMVIVQDERAESALSEHLTLPDWVVSGTEAKSSSFRPTSNHERAIPAFEFTFNASRDTEYYTYKVIIPLLLLVAMSWLVFWVGLKETSTQVSVSITTILTLTAYRFAIGASLPNVSYMTRLDNLILYATLLTFAALAIVIVMSSLRRADRETQARNVQSICRLVFPLLLAIAVLHALYL